ncbi:MAG: hypothetical protein H7A33_04585 [Deltaproteobacteria bacterium]|nr:hypothetical protein [Deltaproteobacteria bacterium]
MIDDLVLCGFSARRFVGQAPNLILPTKLTLNDRLMKLFEITDFFDWLFLDWLEDGNWCSYLW